MMIYNHSTVVTHAWWPFQAPPATHGSSGDLHITARTVGRVTHQRERIVNGSADEAESLLRQTSLYPQPGELGAL